MKGILLYLKDKQFYVKDESMRIVGNFNKVKKLIADVELLHIIDMDLSRGKLSNYDVYDLLTREKYVQTEVLPKHAKVAGRLQEIDVRVVLLPNYEGFQTLDKKFLAARVEKEDERWIAEKIRDIVTSNKEIATSLKETNRVFYIGEGPLKDVFCNISIKMVWNQS